MIRLAGLADVPGITACDRSSSEGLERGALVREAIIAKRCPIAERAGTVVGFAIWHDRFFGNAFLELLFVADDSRRQGIGASLVQAFAATTDAPKLFTSTNESNTPMRALLDRLGWMRCGWIDQLDPGDPELIYVLLRQDVERPVLR